MSFHKGAGIEPEGTNSAPAECLQWHDCDTGSREAEAGILSSTLACGEGREGRERKEGAEAGKREEEKALEIQNDKEC